MALHRIFKALGLNSIIGITSWILSLLFVLPLLSLFVLSLSLDSYEVWQHLTDTVLGGYIYRSIVLVAGVAIGTFIIGITAGWLISTCRFPMHSLFEILLLLPMAIPAYVMAFIFTDQLEYAGNVQIFLRWLFDWETKADYYFPEIRSIGGAIACLTLVLYPYVYLMSRSGFKNTTQNNWDAARLSGYSPMTTFYRIALPLARPNIIVGIAIVMMETLSDFGTISYFAVNALSRGVYDVWIEMDSLIGASQISLIMITFIMVLLYVEHKNRQTGKHYQNTNRPMNPIQLSGIHSLLAIIFCGTISLIGFIIPAGILLSYAVIYFDISWSSKFLGYAYNSLTLAGTTAVFTMVITTIMAYSIRLNQKNIFLKKITALASIGYGIPGTVLGVGVLVPLSYFDNSIDNFFETYFGINTGLLLTGSILGLTYAYSVRFAALGYGGVDTALKSVSPNIEGAARTLGHTPNSIFWRIHLPLIRHGIVLSTILIFVDSMKELSITMVLKPLNFDTLSTHVFSYASSGLLEQSALGSLTIVGVGLIPVCYLIHNIQKN